MASATKKTKLVRRNKHKNAGKVRKTKEQNKGTTVTKEVLFGDN
ncbi:MAG: hypothetical protein ACRBBP_01080 [Bdellovibrionales bacterium]